MKSTALGAENIISISDAHEKFYYEKLQEVRNQDRRQNAAQNLPQVGKTDPLASSIFR